MGAVRTAPGYAGGDTAMRTALDRLANVLGWSEAGRGPFARVVPAGARVLVKPNWVHHENAVPFGIEPLLTHGTLIRAVTESLLEASLSSVTIGDAPIQGCDFPRMLQAAEMPQWADRLLLRDSRFRGLLDFRRTRSVVEDGVRHAAEDQLPLDQFVLFDLGRESLLEEITRPGQFRVTQYDPRLMGRTHAPGRHQYLIARAVIESDVVVNLPKLKTHKKAGVTCALKNLIGINGNKEYLPHHRIGGAATGGDCYPGGSRVKRALEFVLDRANTTSAESAQRAWIASARVLEAVSHAMGDSTGVEGSWSGNDTIWRTCLDLNRVLVYGRLDGTLADTPQRRVLHVVDAVVGGQGDGPLAPLPLELGMLLGGSSAAAVDWVAALLLGYEPTRIPIAAHAFDAFRWPLVDFPSGAVRLAGELGDGPAGAAVGKLTLPAVQHPSGWREAARP